MFAPNKKKKDFEFSPTFCWQQRKWPIDAFHAAVPKRKLCGSDAMTHRRAQEEEAAEEAEVGMEADFEAMWAEAGLQTWERQGEEDEEGDAEAWQAEFEGPTTAEKRKGPSPKLLQQKQQPQQQQQRNMQGGRRKAQSTSSKPRPQASTRSSIDMNREVLRLCDLPWFHGHLKNKQEAEGILLESGAQDGWFIVWCSPNIRGFHISVAHRGRLKHYMVSATSSGFRLPDIPGLLVC